MMGIGVGVGLAQKGLANVNLAAAAESGFWSLSGGVDTANASWRKLPEIDLGNITYLFIQHGGNRADVIWMDGGGTFIQRDTPTGLASGAKIEPPSGAASVRINLSNDGATYDALGDVPIVRNAGAVPLAAPTALAIQHIAHTSASIPVSSTLADGLVIGVTDWATGAQDVRVRGTATGGAGSIVQVRIVEDGDGSVVRNWSTLATISSGIFDGVISVPRGTDYYRFEVRSTSDTAITDTPTQRIGVGAKVMVIGQSQVTGWIGATGASYAAANAGKGSVYAWQASESPAVAEDLHVLDTGQFRDGPSAMIDQLNALGVDCPVMIVRESHNGTGIDDFLVDSDTVRLFSDVTDKTNKYGQDFTAVIEWWDTNNASPFDGDSDIETLFGVSDTTGISPDHTLDDVLQTGYEIVVQMASRHANSTNDRFHAAQKSEYINGTPAAALSLTHGWPLADFETDGTGPHALSTSNANIYAGYRLALGLAEALGETTLDKSTIDLTAERSATGDKITVPITLSNGGTLAVGSGSEVVGFEVSQDSGSTWTDRNDGTDPFTATISGSTVVITKDSGTWAAANLMQVRFLGHLEENPNTGFSASLEAEIINGSMYETGVANVLGPGLPVNGVDDSGDYHFDSVAVIGTVTQEAGAAPSATSVSHVPQSPTSLITRDGSADATDFVVADVDIGAADSDRWVVVALGQLASAGEVNSVSLGGVSFVKAAGTTWVSGTDEGAHVWVSSAKIPTGTSGELTIGFSGAVFSIGAEIYRLIKSASATTPFASNTFKDITASGFQGIDINTAAGGAMVLSAQRFGTGTSVTISMSPDIKDQQRDLRSGEFFATGHDATVLASPRAQQVGSNQPSSGLAAVAVAWD